MERFVRLDRRRTDVFDAETASRQHVVVEAGAYRRPESAAGPAPTELYLVALASCAAATVEEIVTKMRGDLHGMRVAVDAQRATSVPRIWTDIHLTYVLRSSLPRHRLEHVLDLVDRTCSVSAMVEKAANLSRSLVTVERVDPAITRPLRQRMLRPHQDEHELRVSGEDHPDAAWFAAHLDGRVVGTAGALPQPTPDGRDGWRVRAMAVEQSLQGAGLGAELLAACLEHANDGLVWCSAREPAAGFYQAHGFEAVSEVYDEPGVGPHVTMVRAAASR